MYEKFIDFLLRACIPLILAVFCSCSFYQWSLSNWCECSVVFLAVSCDASTVLRCLFAVDFDFLELTRFSSHYTQLMVKLSSQELSEREAKEQASYRWHIAKCWNVELPLGRSCRTMCVSCFLSGTNCRDSVHGNTRLSLSCVWRERISSLFALVTCLLLDMFSVTHCVYDSIWFCFHLSLLKSEPLSATTCWFPFGGKPSGSWSLSELGHGDQMRPGDNPRPALKNNWCDDVLILTCTEPARVSVVLGCVRKSRSKRQSCCMAGS